MMNHWKPYENIKKSFKNSSLSLVVQISIEPKLDRGVWYGMIAKSNELNSLVTSLFPIYIYCQVNLIVCVEISQIW
jgi:hypothetical protein